MRKLGLALPKNFQGFALLCDAVTPMRVVAPGDYDDVVLVDAN